MKDAPSTTTGRNAAAPLLFLAPVLAYWIYCLLVQPAPHYDGIDPEYEYFLNSLGAFKRQPYAYVDHPGTPLEMIGTVVLAGTYPWLAGNTDGFVGFHLRHPQVFFTLVYGLLLAAHLLCVLVFFRIALRDGRTGPLLAAALATLYFAIQPDAFNASLLWSHNSFSFPLGTLLLLGLYAGLNRPEREGSRSLLAWIGIGLGVGILSAITIFLASWAIGVLVSLVLYFGLFKRDWRQTLQSALAFSVAGVAGFDLSVLPVITRMGGFWNWIYSILSHQSNYLAVPAHQPILVRLSTNTAALLHMLPALFIGALVTLALSLAAFIAWRHSIQEKPALWALVGGLAAQMIALTLVFLDRPLRAYYFLAVAAILPVLVLVVLRLYERVPGMRRVLAVSLSAVVLLGLIVNSAQAVRQRQQITQMQARSAQLIQQIVLERSAQVNRPPDQLMLLWTYGTYSPCWALWFGDHRSGDVFDSEITQICGKQFELTGRVLVPNARLPLENTNWDIVFTCERYTDNVLVKEPGALVRLYPDIEWTCGKMAAVFNR